MTSARTYNFKEDSIAYSKGLRSLSVEYKPELEGQKPYIIRFTALPQTFKEPWEDLEIPPIEETIVQPLLTMTLPVDRLDTALNRLQADGMLTAEEYDEINRQFTVIMPENLARTEQAGAQTENALPKLDHIVGARENFAGYSFEEDTPSSPGLEQEKHMSFAFYANPDIGVSELFAERVKLRMEQNPQWGREIRVEQDEVEGRIVAVVKVKTRFPETLMGDLRDIGCITEKQYENFVEKLAEERAEQLPDGVTPLKR